jgi:ketosteroid isomerase-like protein
MSEENVELVRRGYEHFARTGEPDASLYASDIEWHSAAEDPGQEVFHGVEGVKKLIAEVQEAMDVTVAYGHEEFSRTIRHYIGAFEDYDYEARGLTDLGSGAVLALVTEEGRGKSSGVPVRQSFAVLYTVIDGKIVRVTFFASEEQALEAAGVSE